MDDLLENGHIALGLMCFHRMNRIQVCERRHGFKGILTMCFMKIAQEKVNCYKRRGHVEEGFCCWMEDKGHTIEGESLYRKSHWK